MKKIFLLLVLVLFMTGCSSGVTKPAKNINDFETIALNKGFIVPSENHDYDNAANITDFSKAILKSEENVQIEKKIEMIIYSDVETADAVQKSHIEQFDLLKSTGAQAKKEKGKNFYHHSMVSNNMYMISSRIDNTLIFGKIPVADKELVESLITELGY